MSHMNQSKKNYFVVLQYHGKYVNDEEKIDYGEMKRVIEESLGSFCNDQLYCERYDISLGKPYYDIKKITLFINLIYTDTLWDKQVEISASDRIRNIFFDISGSRIAFKKKADNMYVFEPIQPLQCRNCINSEYNIVIDVNETKRMFVNKIIVSIEFQNNEIINGITSINQLVEPKVFYELNNGVGKFIQN
jgi:hypothetical protein